MKVRAGMRSCMPSAANAAHGIRRSNADKRRAVEMLLSDEEWRQLSNIRNARRCVVSHTFVNSVREEFIA